MLKRKAVLLSVGSLSVIAAAALAQQAMYPAQKPSPAVPYGQQGQQEQAMTYEQALAMQQSWKGQQGGNQAGQLNEAQPSGSAEAAPVGVDPEGNPIFGAVPSTNTPAGSAGSASASGSRNEAQIAADQLRQNPQAAEQAYAQAPQSQGYSGGYQNQTSPQSAQPYPQQPNQQQPYQQQYGQQQAYPNQQYGQQQPDSQQQPGQQAYPQQGYTGPDQGYGAPNQDDGYAQSTPRQVGPPPAAVVPYGTYPPPPVVVYGYPYPYGYPYGYGVGIRIGGYYGGGYLRGGYGFRGGYVGRGFAGGVRGGYVRGGRR